MSDTPLPLGQRFSRIYLERQPLLTDSPRMRTRLAGLFDGIGLHTPEWSMHSALKRELGIAVPYRNKKYLYDGFFKNSDIKDILDSITVIYKHIRTNGDDAFLSNAMNLGEYFASNLAKVAITGITFDQIRNKWKNEVRRIFAEETMAYRLDDACGVHRAIDEEHERNVAATIAGLSAARYAGARAAFTSATAALDRMPPDGKTALRSAFEAVEILFKLLFPRAVRLGGREIQEHLAPCIQATYSGDETAKRANLKIALALATWVDAMHFYRHGQGEESPVQPPLSLSTLAVNTAAVHLRWLAELEPAVPPPRAIR